jgi:hypothetical protein
LTIVGNAGGDAGGVAAGGVEAGGADGGDMVIVWELLVDGDAGVFKNSSNNSSRETVQPIVRRSLVLVSVGE